MRLNDLRYSIWLYIGLGIILALPGCSFRVAVPSEILGEAPSAVPTAVFENTVTPALVPTETIPAIPTQTALPSATPTNPPAEPTPIGGGSGSILLQCVEQQVAWVDLYRYDLRSGEYAYADPEAIRSPTERIYDIFISESQDGSRLAWTENYCYDIIDKYDIWSKITRPRCGYLQTKNYLSSPAFTPREEVGYLPYTWLQNGLIVEFRSDPSARDKVQIWLVDTKDGSQQNLGLINRYRSRLYTESSPDGRYALIPLYTYKAEYKRDKVEKLLLIDSQSGESTEIPSPGWNTDEVGKIFWLPDSSGFLFEAVSPGWQYNRFYQGNLDGTQYTVVVERGVSFILSHDQRWLAYVSQPDAAVVLRDLTTGENSTLIAQRNNNLSIISMQFDPQNENLFIFSRLDPLQRVNLASKEVTLIGELVENPGQMISWSPDGSRYLLHWGPVDTSFDPGTTYASYLCQGETCEALRPPGTLNCLGAFWTGP